MIRMKTLRRPRVLCDEDECCPSLMDRILVAAAAGAAPVLANYLIIKLDPSAAAETSDEEDA